MQHGLFGGRRTGIGLPAIGGNHTACCRKSICGRPQDYLERKSIAALGGESLVHQGRIYAVNRAGVLTCGELDGGKIVWRLRLDGHHYATPIAVGNQLLMVSNKGKIQVVQLGDEGQLAAEYELGVGNQATPAVAGGAVYIRSDGHLRRFLSPSRE